ncbi:MAG TPA: methylmalonyl-CoA mutase family protein [Thermoanaerobaculia bacterium]|nr:methylmalonyl-CoA mutase family protein [Thermoanaerobaculia bacterium]
MSRPLTDSTAAAFAELGRDEWRVLAQRSLRGRPLGSLAEARLDGVLLPAIEFPDDRAAEPAQTPGVAPFRRGARAAGVHRGWDLRSIHRQPSPEIVRREILEDLEGGATSIELGIEDPSSGSTGLRLGALDDLERALADVDVAIAPVALAAGDGFREAGAALIALWRRRGLESARCRGAFNADPIGVAARRGGFDADGLSRLAELVLAVADSHPQVTCARADASLYHDAGASEDQELAFLLSTGLAYLRAMVDAGVVVSVGLRQIVLRCAVDADFLTGLAKVRALRELWARVASVSLESAGETGDSGTVPPPIVEAVPGRRGLSRVDPWTNLLRVGSAMVGAALGGADVLVGLPDGDALGLPSRDLARRLARNLQLVLAEEAHLHRVIDPAGGSWALEELTDRLGERTWERFQAIEARGGIVAGLREGWLRSELAETAGRRVEAARSRRSVMIGVNDFCDPADVVVEPERGPAGATEPLGPAGADLRELSVAEAVQALSEGAALGRGTPRIEEAFEPVAPHRTAEPFERLREAVDARLPRDDRAVFLASLGAAGECSARASFAAGWLAVGGLEAVVPDAPCESADELAAALRRSGRRVAILCSSDALYAERGVETAKALRAAGARHLAIAGGNSDLADALRRAGIEQFLVAGADLVAELEILLDALERASERSQQGAGGAR